MYSIYHHNFSRGGTITETLLIIQSIVQVFKAKELELFTISQRKT